ncbi:MAG: hypothetical protein WA637_18390 [Terriglobales bacterium]
MGKFAARSLISLIGILAAVCSAQTGKVEKVGPLTDPAVPEAVRQTLDPAGYRISLDDGTAFCELWLRKSISAQAKTDAADVVYPQLVESTLVGVLHYPKGGSDYRGQTISAGFYTLRYELMPSDANHLGAAPNRDFLLLVPAASDADPNTLFKFPDLVALSERATGTRHPGCLSLVQHENGSTAPGVSKDDQDHWIFSANLEVSTGEEISFAVVVKGTAQQ